MGMMWMIWSRRLCTLYFSFLFIHLFLIISITHSPLTRRIRRPDKQLMLSNLPTPPAYISRLTSYSPLISFLCLDSVPTYLWEHDEPRFITFITCVSCRQHFLSSFFLNPPRILLITFHYLRINIICLFSTNKIVVVVFLYYFPTNKTRKYNELSLSVMVSIKSLLSNSWPRYFASTPCRWLVGHYTYYYCYKCKAYSCAQVTVFILDSLF